MSLRNLHACLVHESRECVIDLVRNLHHLDPDSHILLYNGGHDANLLAGFPWDKYNAIVHPAPKPMKWGWLHDFALDCMRFGLEQLPFDTMTVVDSDQLGLRAGYSAYLAEWLAGRTGVGMLGSAAPPRGRMAAAPPAAQAYQEVDLWRPFLRRFEGGEAKFVHWTFWPTTVFTAEAARALLTLWPDAQLQGIVARTKIWASEEVILPTLVALLGYGVEVNPCRHDYVRYRVRYSTAQMDAGLAQPQTFWVHPVPRRYDDPLRAHVRRRLADYDRAEGGAPVSRIDERKEAGLLLTLPILNEIRPLEGWLSDEEADLLLATAARAMSSEGPQNIVEVGSYCGKATVALGRVVQGLGREARVFAIDPFDGVVGSRDGALSNHGPTRAKCEANLARAGLTDLVEIRQARSAEVPWQGPIRLLVVDGLHDYQSVAADFHHFADAVAEDGYVAFHDYAHYYPGVRLFVNELLAEGQWLKVRAAGSLIVLRRSPDRASRAVAVPRPTSEAPPQPLTVAPVIQVAGPSVSCIMPTANRRAFVPHAIRHFLAQDYPARELVIVDDGNDDIRDLVPSDPRIRVLRLGARHSVGEKRNIACRTATGALIVHWDDDDWMATWRLRYQVEELERHGATFVGLDAVHYHDLGTDQSWQYRYPAGARHWVAGNTLCYRKATWSRRPFPDLNVGEDARFVWADPAARIVAHQDDAFFVAMIHGRNVAKKTAQHRFWHPIPTQKIRDLMGADFDVYRQMIDLRSDERAAGG